MPHQTSNAPARGNTAASSRGEETRRALMRAVETLAVNKGLENLSIREILIEAQQKNESALQYHFGSLSGLINALIQERTAQIAATRAEKLAGLLSATDQPDLRALCEVMVLPAFNLAQASPDFRHYVSAFGHKMILANDDQLKKYARGLGASARQTNRLLRQALPELGSTLFTIRINQAMRLATAAMADQAKRKRGFQGKTGRLFIESLIDSIEALLRAPISSQTARALEASRPGTQ